jgi:hypothetical protein
VIDIEHAIGACGSFQAGQEQARAMNRTSIEPLQ